MGRVRREATRPRDVNIMATSLIAPSRTTWERIKADFPILSSRNARGQDLVFLDSAASSQKPLPVIEALDSYYRENNANIHRGVYDLSQRASEAYEEARRKVAAFINAASPREIIFVRNTTEAINLVAQTWGRQHVGPDDVIVVTELDHHSNIIPWQLLAEDKGARLEAVRIDGQGRLDQAHFAELLALKPKIVALPHVSNALGTMNPVAEMIAKAHEAGAVVLIDGAQSVPHMPVDVQALDADFLAFSGHKMLAPMGSGALFGKLPILEAMPPFMGGGGMIRKVRIDGSTWADVPARFEAGTPAVGDAIGLGAAVDYLQAIGMDEIREHERKLTALALDRLRRISGLTIYGPDDPDAQGGVISFALEGIHPHDVAAILDEENVAVRAGHHCCQPLMDRLDVPSTTRASFYVYNTEEDVERLVQAIERAQAVFAVQEFAAR